MPDYRLLMNYEGFKPYMTKVIWYISAHIDTSVFRIHCQRLFVGLKIMNEEDFVVYSKLYLKKYP